MGRNDRLTIAACFYLVSAAFSPIVWPVGLAIASHPPIAMSSSVTPQSALTRIFQTRRVSADWFSPDFLAAVPVDRLQAIIDGLTAELGNFESVRPDGDRFIVNFQRGFVPARIAVDAAGKISGLLFESPTKKLANIGEAVTQFQSLPGRVSLLVLEGNTVRAKLNDRQSLAVASAFKLSILDVLQEKIKAGKLSWQQVVPLQEKYKTLPSGRLQTWPNGSFLTVQSLAAMMISESDNTATDHIIHLIGREEIEKIYPQNIPLLTTREMFQLKSRQNLTLLNRYRRGNLAVRRTILNELSRLPLPDVAEFNEGNPLAADIEWFFNSEDLCKTMERVSPLPLMSINPGVANPQQWQRVAYKGGSNGGVLNLTTSLQGKNGRRYCVSATWNDDRPLDNNKFFSLYSGLLDILPK